MPSLMQFALRRERPQGQVTAAPIAGPATQEMPTGQTTVLDELAAKRKQLFAEYQTLQADQGAALQVGEQAYLQALHEARLKAENADSAYRRVAAQRGMGRFTGAPG